MLWLQAIFDPSQGWTNALIFLLLSNGSLRAFHSLKAKARRKMTASCCLPTVQSRLEPCAGAGAGDNREDQVSYQVLAYDEDSNNEE